MNDHHIPQDEPQPTPYAVFQCLDCGYHFAYNIPAIFEDLPKCCLCQSASQIDRLLVCNDSLPANSYYYGDGR